MSIYRNVKCKECKGSGVVSVANPVALREAREKAGLSAKEMAKRLNFSPAYICDIEYGRRNCTEEVLAAYKNL